MSLGIMVGLGFAGNRPGIGLDRSRSRKSRLMAYALLLSLAASVAFLCQSEAAGSGPPPATTCALSAAQDGDHPVAYAGPDQTVYAGALVTLNGSGSNDDVGIVNYTWHLYDDGLRTLYGGEVSYRFNRIGAYSVTLNVTDTDGNHDEDVLVVTVLAPVAEAGVNQTIYTGMFALFDGSGSLGTDLNYTWNFTYAGQEVVLYGQTASFMFNRTGTYVTTLTVRDAANLTANDTMTIHVLRVSSWFEENWLMGTFYATVVVLMVFFVLRKWRKDHALVTRTDVEKMQLQIKNAKRIWRLYRANMSGMIGLIILMAFVFVAIFAPWLATHDNPNSTTWARYNPSWHPPSTKYLLGTGDFGKDVYSMTVIGTRASLIVGIFASLISIVMGATIGIMAGYFGKISDEVLMRITDFFLVIPWFPLMIVLAALMGRSFTNVIIVIGITSWPSTARIVRAQVLSVKEKAFVERARAVGARDGWILGKHIMPNVFPLIFANTILLIANAIFSESFLDFFGLGDPSVLSWGIMLENAYKQGAFARFAWWYILAPGGSIVLLIMAFYLIGDALDEVLNPKLRRR